MTDKEKPVTGDEVWAMYDGPNEMKYGLSAKTWYQVEFEWGNGFKILGKTQGHFWTGWQRHVGPTPPDAQAMPATSPSDWITHDGSPDRPKGVGKRDVVESVWYFADVYFAPRLLPANELNWRFVTRYRIITRAPKKEKLPKFQKVWVAPEAIIYSKELKDTYEDDTGEKLQALFLKVKDIAKLKEVTE